MLIFKKEKQVVALAREHSDSITECVRSATAAVKAYVAGDLDEAKRLATEVDKSESRADTHRREIADLLYSGAYLPNMREDVFSVIDEVDKIANKAESCCDFFVDQQPEIPAEFGDQFVAMMDGCLDTYLAMRKALKDFFKPKGQMEDLRKHADEVGRLESLVDEKEAALTAAIFASSMDIGHKIHLRQAVRYVVRIADQTEDSRDQIELVSMKSLI